MDKWTKDMLWNWANLWRKRPLCFITFGAFGRVAHEYSSVNEDYWFEFQDKKPDNDN